MKLDGFAGSVTARQAPDAVNLAESRGQEIVWISESDNDAMMSALAGFTGARPTSLAIGTSVSLAFARSPMTTALQAWELAQVSNGRFILGLGSGSKKQIEQRYGMTYGKPAARMRDYIVALHQIWQSWRDDVALRVDTEHYQLTSDERMYRPDAHDFAIPVYVAAVGPAVTKAIGEVADGAVAHPLATPTMFETMSTHLQAGIKAAGRRPSDVSVVSTALVALKDAPDHAEQRGSLGKRILWYAARQQYRPLFEAAELGNWAAQVAELDAAALRRHVVSNEIVEQFAVVSNQSDLGDDLAVRLGGQVDGVALLFDRLADLPLVERSVRERIATAQRSW